MRRLACLAWGMALVLSASAVRAAQPTGPSSVARNDAAARRLLGKAPNDFHELVRDVGMGHRHWDYTFYGTPFLTGAGICEVRAVQLYLPTPEEPEEASNIQAFYFLTTRPGDRNAEACRGPVGHRTVIAADGWETVKDAIAMLSKTVAAAGGTDPSSLTVKSVCWTPEECVSDSAARASVAGLRAQDVLSVKLVEWPGDGGAYEIEFAGTTAHAVVRIFEGAEARPIKAELQWVQDVRF